MVMLPAGKLCFENPPSRRRTVQKEELGKKQKQKTPQDNNMPGCFRESWGGKDGWKREQGGE